MPEQNEKICVKRTLHPNKPLDLVRTSGRIPVTIGTTLPINALLTMNGSIQELRFKMAEFIPITGPFNVLIPAVVPATIALIIPTIIYDKSCDECKAYLVTIPSQLNLTPFDVRDIDDNNLGVSVTVSSDGCSYILSINLLNLDGTLANVFDGCELVLYFRLFSLNLIRLCIDPCALNCDRLGCSSCENAWQWVIATSRTFT